MSQTIYEPKICGLQSRAVSNQEQVMMARVLYLEATQLMLTQPKKGERGRRVYRKASRPHFDPTQTRPIQTHFFLQKKLHSDVYNKALGLLGFFLRMIVQQ